jgi:hypothetical protein
MNTENTTDLAVMQGQWVCEIPHQRAPFAYQSRIAQTEADLRDLHNYHVFDTEVAMQAWAATYTGHQYPAVRAAVLLAF